ncbi:MAG: GNAT family N-acetyltransferase [Anaerolinea sp.]|nr:GNAT family N-acetyltransferase [Anaerolinea sp.]
MAEIEIRPLHALAEMRAAVDLQTVYWGNESESVIPAHMLFSLANHGGHVLAAFDGDKMVGVLVGFLGTNMEEADRPAMANLQIVSKRMVVLPDYRGDGIGYRLKRAQRSMAITQGIRLIVWTFDPLLSTNAHLNIRKLAAISHEYLEDYYGTDESGGLARLGSSDRLAVEWWVTNRRVEDRLYGKRSDVTFSQYLEAETPILNPTTVLDSGFAAPSATTAVPKGSLALLEIPVNTPQIERVDPDLAHVWRMHIREQFKLLFGRGYVVTDFLHETHEGRERAFYLLSYNGPQFESFSMN